MKPLEVWQPRYSTDDCCVLARKIVSDSQQYSIYFTKAKHLEGKRFVMTGAEIKKHSKLERTKQGGKKVYAIPMGILESYEVKNE